MRKHGATTRLRNAPCKKMFMHTRTVHFISFGWPFVMLKALERVKNITLWPTKLKQNCHFLQSHFFPLPPSIQKLISSFPSCEYIFSNSDTVHGSLFAGSWSHLLPSLSPLFMLSLYLFFSPRVYYAITPKPWWGKSEISSSFFRSFRSFALCMKIRSKQSIVSPLVVWKHNCWLNRHNKHVEFICLCIS